MEIDNGAEHPEETIYVNNLSLLFINSDGSFIKKDIPLLNEFPTTIDCIYQYSSSLIQT